MTKLTQGGELKQTFKMTTNMQQSISMLQMSSLEIRNFASQELSKNPFLEDDTISEESLVGLKKNETHKLENYANSSRKSSDDYDFLANISTEKTLKEYLIEQINIEFDNHSEKIIAFYLLDSLKNNGYIELNYVEAINNLKCSEELINTVLERLQTLDPSGIFARNIKECLKLQVRDKNILTPKIITLIDNLELVADGEFKKLQKICKADAEELKNLIIKLKTLNPKPANGFMHEQTIYKIPDVILFFNNEREIRLEINQDSIPKIKFNEEYYIKIKNLSKDREEKDFSKRELTSANNLIKAVELRTKTILKVAACIVEQQIEFFTRGLMYLKPLTLAKVAELTGFNESTISRTTINKYILTPSGTYELKYFFSSGLTNTKVVGSEISSTKVKEIIKQVIMTEDKTHILSDEEISKHLKKFNIDIARRTVAKYRESINIPTSSVRKKRYY